VGTLEGVIEERLEQPATLRQLCEHVDVRLGPIGGDPVNLVCAVHGHLRRLLRGGGVLLLDVTERPPRFQRAGRAAA